VLSERRALYKTLQCFPVAGLLLATARIQQAKGVQEMAAHELPQKIIDKLPQKVVDNLHQNDPDELQKHVTSTYRNLRRMLAIIGFLFPLFLPLVGKYWYGIPFQNSMSAYYFAGSNGEGPIRSWLTSLDFSPLKYILFVMTEAASETPLRSWFVGILFVMGVFLYIYKGFSDIENYLLNGAGLSALGVALFPMEWNCGDACHWFTLHGVFAVVLFICIAFVALFCSGETLLKRPLSAERNTYYRNWYFWLGLGMIASPLAAWAITKTIGSTGLTFFVEWFGIWTFAAYWWIKSNELSENKAEIHAAEKTPEPPSALAAQSGATATPTPAAQSGS
jgi:hypothetical protein